MEWIWGKSKELPLYRSFIWNKHLFLLCADCTVWKAKNNQMLRNHLWCKNGCRELFCCTLVMVRHCSSWGTFHLTSQLFKGQKFSPKIVEPGQYQDFSGSWVANSHPCGLEMPSCPHKQLNKLKIIETGLFSVVVVMVAQKKSIVFECIGAFVTCYRVWFIKKGSKHRMYLLCHQVF